MCVWGGVGRDGTIEHCLSKTFFFLNMQGPSLYTVKAVFILDNDGNRLLSKVSGTFFLLIVIYSQLYFFMLKNSVIKKKKKHCNAHSVTEFCCCPVSYDGLKSNEYEHTLKPHLN